MGSTETGRSGLKYWLVIGFLIVFGLLTIFSIPCETSTPPYPHTCIRSDSILIEIGRLLRELHDATRALRDATKAPVGH